MKKLLMILLFIFALSLVSAALPETLTLHGKLTDDSGNMLTGTYNMTFRIYDAPSAGNQLWEKINQSVTTDIDGIYHTILKGIDNLTFADEYYLGVAVESDSEMTPRINLTSAPYSFRANESDYWANVTSYNETQMENSGGFLSILDSWLTTKITDIWNSLFRNFFDQSLNTTDSPTFAGEELTGNLDMWGNNITNFTKIIFGSSDLIFCYNGTDLLIGNATDMTDC